MHEKYFSSNKCKSQIIITDALKCCIKLNTKQLQMYLDLFKIQGY